MHLTTLRQSILFLVAMACLAPGQVTAADLDSPALPSDPASAVYRLDDLYNRLHTGAVVEKRSGAFSEPSAVPAAGASKGLDEIMAIAPAPDNVHGATPADVQSGKTFWGLRTDGGWGPLTGSGEVGGGAAYPAPVPQSGQTLSYAAGDDGATKLGVALPSPRFTDNGNGTVTDNLTGLIWLKNANCFGARAWAQALSDAANLNSGECGLSDGSTTGSWRLPNRRELFSLINMQYYSPSLSNTAGTGKWQAGDPFSGVQSSFYWSSTTTAYSTTHAWFVHFDYGNVSHNDKASSRYVWPVRGGQ